MKYSIAFFALISAFFLNNILAESFMSEADQMAFMEREAKDIRRNLWRADHQDVESRQRFISLKELQEYTLGSQNNRYLEPLDSNEISDLFSCYHRENCRLIVVYVSSDYWGGYGTETHFLLLDLITEKARRVSHVTYSE